MIEKKQNVLDVHFVSVVRDRFVIGDVISECWTDRLLIVYCVLFLSECSFKSREMYPKLSCHTAMSNG
jgi:hypothetical protein